MGTSLTGDLKGVELSISKLSASLVVQESGLTR